MTSTELPTITPAPTPPPSHRAFARGTEILDERGERDPKRPPPVQMRLMLTAAKKAGVPFERAWARAWQNIAWPSRTEYPADRYILALMRPVWRDAYVGLDPVGRLHAINAIEAFGMPGLEAVA